jgi:hypothetical protein
MTTRTALLFLHIAAAAGWLGADFVQYGLAPRFERQGPEGALAWSRAEIWLHERYYAAVVTVLLATGVLLVLDGDWSWSSDFIWVGVGAIVVGAGLGGGRLGPLAKQRVAALEAGDAAGADAVRRRMIPIQVVVTLAPLLALLAMVDRWEA